MAPPTKGGTEAHTPVRRDSIGEKIGIAEMKTDYLRALGVDTSRMEKRLKKAKSAFGAKNYEASEVALDELLVLFSVLTKEVEEIIDRFLGSGKKKVRSTAALRGGGQPTLEEVRETVEDAFLKSLHSQNLRRMVEVIALEKVRSILTEGGVPQKWVASNSRSGRSKKKAGKKKRGR